MNSDSSFRTVCYVLLSCVLTCFLLMIACKVLSINNFYYFFVARWLMLVLSITLIVYAVKFGKQNEDQTKTYNAFLSVGIIFTVIAFGCIIVMDSPHERAYNPDYGKWPSRV